MDKAQTAVEHKQLSTAQGKQIHSDNKLESNTTVSLIKQIAFSLYLPKHQFQISFSIFKFQLVN